MSEVVERVAARMWKAESEDAGTPASVTARRTYDAFLDQSDDTRARWRKFARAAILEMPPPTPEMIAAAWKCQPAGPCCDWDIEEMFRSMIDEALR
jgi:hypothetical protein